MGPVCILPCICQISTWSTRTFGWWAEHVRSVFFVERKFPSGLSDQIQPRNRWTAGTLAPVGQWSFYYFQAFVLFLPKIIPMKLVSWSMVILLLVGCKGGVDVKHSDLTGRWNFSRLCATATRPRCWMKLILYFTPTNPSLPTSSLPMKERPWCNRQQIVGHWQRSF